MLSLEFVAKDFQDLMTRYRIDHRTTESPDIKAGNAERYIRTLKTRLWKYFTKHKTYRYMNVLQTLVRAINTSYSDTIGCRPIDVTIRNEKTIRQRVNKQEGKKPVFLFNVGDKVRIARERKAFRKGYQPNYTEEVFTVVKCIPRRPIPVYMIQDLEGEEIRGVFYPAELVQAAAERI